MISSVSFCSFAVTHSSEQFLICITFTISVYHTQFSLPLPIYKIIITQLGYFIMTSIFQNILDELQVLSNWKQPFIVNHGDYCVDVQHCIGSNATIPDKVKDQEGLSILKGTKYRFPKTFCGESSWPELCKMVQESCPGCTLIQTCGVRKGPGVRACEWFLNCQCYKLQQFDETAFADGKVSKVGIKKEMKPGLMRP